MLFLVSGVVKIYVGSPIYPRCRERFSRDLDDIRASGAANDPRRNKLPWYNMVYRAPGLVLRSGYIGILGVALGKVGVNDSL